MHINYNRWFYDYHKYLKGTRNGNTTFNDTKWKYIGERYQTLIDLSSHILHDQPYNVIGNDYAFNRLLELLNNSNYTFEDVNESLIKAYKFNLRNAMSRMVTNTHNVLFECKNTDAKYVYVDKISQKYIVEVPFMQMHFGERDEFIRQKIQMMHQTSTDYYVPMKDFYDTEVSKILGFTILCTVNGYISNDCEIAMSEKGLRFKIGWTVSNDCTFMIYKLDECYVHTFTDIPLSTLNQPFNNSRTFTLELSDDGILSTHVGQKCIVNIYDPNYVSSGTIPNFGVVTSWVDNDITKYGVTIHNVQIQSINNVKEFGSLNYNVRVYILKYFHEVQGIYPAINYMDIAENKYVYTDHENAVYTENEKRVVLSKDNNINYLETITPPICIDKPVKNAFTSFSKCLILRDIMLSSERLKEINNVIAWMNNGHKQNEFSKVTINLGSYITYIKPYYYYYMRCAITTSLIESKYVNRFRDFMEFLDAYRNIGPEDYENDVSKFDLQFEEFLGGYSELVDTLCVPFETRKLENYQILDSLNHDYYEDTTSSRFNRPVSEQSFITLQYDRISKCWLFANPNIKHFTGIGNAFYIDNKLTGDEIFKFFVLYSDTESPSEPTIDTSSLNALDFDTFYEEINKHIGFIRYWYAENKLMKLSYIYQRTASSEDLVQILSKILKKKMDGEDLLYEYDSDINYEESNMTTDNIEYTSNVDERSPFALNFLFYTLSLLQNNEDKLQSYFYKQLTDRHFVPRYADVDISSVIHQFETVPVNLSIICTRPTVFDTEHMKLSNKCMYYGLPNVFQGGYSDSSIDYYPYTFNMYKNTNVKYYLMEDSHLNPEYYMRTQNDSNMVLLDASTDIHLTRLITFYLSNVYDCISYLETNYTNTLNKMDYIKTSIHTIETSIEKIKSYIIGKTFMNPSSVNIANTIITDNPILNVLRDMRVHMRNVLRLNYSDNVYRMLGKYTTDIGKVYQTQGFKQHYLQHARQTYIHMKKINKPMNLYKYRRFWETMNMEYMRIANKTKSDNPNKSNINLETRYQKIYRCRIEILNTLIDGLQVSYQDLSTLRTTHIRDITMYCKDILDSYIFNMYTLNDITIQPFTNNKKPAYAIITLPIDDHVRYPYQSTTYTQLTFHPICDKTNNRYVVNEIIPSVVYAFFDDTPFTTLQCTFYDDTGTSLGTTNVTNMTFMKVCNTSDALRNIDMIPSVCNTRIDIQNKHEIMDTLTPSQQYVVSHQYGIMNYEMLFGNKFYQLDYDSEFVRKPPSELSGPMDRVYLSNYELNKLAIEERSKHSENRMFFKPVQVLHFQPDIFNRIHSIGGGNFVNQRIYLSTPDTNYIFPVTITQIDHNQSRGFLEAKVEYRNAKWLEITDKQTIGEYLTNTITCTILPDNISNFLDEFSNDDYPAYNPCTFDIDEEYEDENFPDTYSFPGDPIFVHLNTKYTYTRLNYHLSDMVDHRFLDTTNETHRFIYLGHTDSRFTKSLNPNDPTVKMEYLMYLINHHFNTLSTPEMYPLLRDEPNDHSIWKKEIDVFTQKISEYTKLVNTNNILISQKRQEYVNTTDFDIRFTLQTEIDELTYKRDGALDWIEKLTIWRNELEKPSSWYNVNSYDAAMTYVDNGRAPIAHSFHEDIRDIPIFDEIQIFIYNWETHEWVDPSLYELDFTQPSSNAKFFNLDNPDNFYSNNVMDHTFIHFKQGFPVSKKLLIYLAYDSSKFTIHDDISQTCQVQFKPILSLYQDTISSNLYKDLKLRKVFDVCEEYQFNRYNAPDTFSNTNAFHIIRPRSSNKTSYAPIVRLCDLELISNNVSHTILDLNVYMKNPFPDVTIPSSLSTPSYTTLTYLPMDDFVPNQRIKLICIQNTISSNKKYDGTISTYAFEAVTGDTKSDPITILSSTVNYGVSGTFICTVFMDSAYKCKGGIYSVSIAYHEQYQMDSKQRWIRIPTNDIYKELPNEFIVEPKTTYSMPITIQLKSTYENTNMAIMENNDGRTNLMEYYYDTKNHIRMPISDVTHDNHHKRLTINTNTNTDIKVVHTTYVNVCRYSLHNIPNNGFIDVTGYIPTPLSRDRYEFWVNGRYIPHDDVIILSPTSFQLRNLKSLHNFELIELVDDVTDSQLMNKGDVYIALDGTIYSSFEKAMCSNKNIINQDIQYTFNTYPNHTKLQDYLPDMIKNPHNRDVEVDILNGYRSNNPSRYDQLSNLPSINGVTINHVITDHLGIQEIPFDKIIKLYDNVWKKEILDNPLFPITHKDSSMMSDTFNRIHIHPSDTYEDMYVVHVYGLNDKYHTLYISTLEDGLIHEYEYTQKIIPFVRCGTRIHIDKKYKGMWLHTTASNYTPIIIQ